MGARQAAPEPDYLPDFQECLKLLCDAHGVDENALVPKTAIRIGYLTMMYGGNDELAQKHLAQIQGETISMRQLAIEAMRVVAVMEAQQPVVQHPAPN